MAKIILHAEPYGWSAMFFGVNGMPEDYEIPTTETTDSLLEDVVANMRKRFPSAEIWYRDKHDRLTRCTPTADEILCQAAGDRASFGRPVGGQMQRLIRGR